MLVYSQNHSIITGMLEIFMFIFIYIYIFMSDCKWVPYTKLNPNLFMYYENKIMYQGVLNNVPRF